MRWICFRFDRLPVGGLGQARGGYVGVKTLRARDWPCVFRVFHGFKGSLTTLLYPEITKATTPFGMETSASSH
jgi:hypothetical protein